jgi:hypothetical protein
MAGVQGIDHVNLSAPVELLEPVHDRYVDVIGLRESPRLCSVPVPEAIG